MQSGAHAAHTIERRLEGKEPKPLHYRDLGTLAVISRFTAVAKIGPLRLGGFLGWLIWLVVHITFLTGFKNRFGALARWTISFIGRGRYERALVGRWVAGPEKRDGEARKNLRKVRRAPTNDPRGEPCPSPSRPLPG